MKYLKKTYRHILLLFLFILLAYPVTGNSEYVQKRFLGDIVNELGIDLGDANAFLIKKSILREGKENTFWSIKAERDKRILKIEILKNIDYKSAHSHVQERKHVINSLYKNIFSPYPGMVSNIIESPNEFKPKLLQMEVEGEKFPVYLLSSTPRFTYGVTVEDLIRYRGAVAFCYNKKDQVLYRIDLFIPKEEYKENDVLQWIASLKFIHRDKPDRENPLGNAIIKGQDTPLSRNSETSYEDWRDFKDYNLIIIGIEPLGAKHIGAYGYEKNTTPYIDYFSEPSFLFKNAISASSWTLPSFMSWFTSLYPSQHKIVNKYSAYNDKEQTLSNLSELSPSATTLACILRQNGYTTCGFTGGAGVSGTFGYNLGFDIYHDKETFGGFDLVMPAAIDWLRNHGKSKFFLFILGYDVHGRYPPPDKHKDKFINPHYDGKYEGTVEEYWELRNLSLDRGELEMNPEDVKFWESIYDAKIYEADRKFGRFVESLKKLGLINKTIIIISSGSGNEYYEHKRFDHGFSLYEELIRVPLIIKVPGKKGRIVHEQVRTIDIMPTVLDLLDINYDGAVSNQIQGVSLAPLMKGEELILDAFSETDYLLQAFKRSLRTSDGWKYIYSLDTEERELFNLKIDPNETNNLVYDERRIAYELEQKLFKHIKSLGNNILR